MAVSNAPMKKRGAGENEIRKGASVKNMWRIE
jgi:hypothetical protein